MQSRFDDSADLSRRSLLAMAVIAPTLVAGAAESAPAGAIELPPDLAKAIQQHEQATFGNDIVVLGELVAEDYLLVNSDSTLQNKQSYLADFTVPGFKLDPYVMEDPVQKIWGDTALSAGRLHLAWTQDGRRQERRVRIVHVWTKEDGHWRLKYTQLTRIT